MAGLTADVSNYLTQHKIVLDWDDSGAQPANFYSVRLKATNVETGVQRLVHEDLTFGHHDMTDYFAPNNIQEIYDTYVVTTPGGGPQVETHDRTLTVTPSGDDYWLIHPTDPTKTVRLFHASADSYSTEHENTVLNLIGRGRKVDRGETWGITGSITALLRNRAEATARQQKIALDTLKEQAVSVTLQTPFGDSWQVSLMDIAYSRQAGSGPMEHLDATVPYQQVA